MSVESWDNLVSSVKSIDYDKLGKSVADTAKYTQGVLNYAISASNVFVSFAGSVGIAGFVFDIAEDEAVDLSSIITDHYIETGSPVQDHIAMRPERVTVKGLVGEYKDIVTGKKSKLEKITQKLTTLSSYLPALSQAAGSIYNGLNDLHNAKTNLGKLGAVTDIGTGLFEAYRNINIPQNEQQKAFIYFEALRNSKATFTVQTPFRYYTDMAIESMRVVQSGNTADQSSFEVTFKKIRYIDVEINEMENPSSEVEGGETQGRLEAQSQNTAVKGVVPTTKTRLTESINSAFSGKPMSEIKSLKEQIEEATAFPEIKGF